MTWVLVLYIAGSMPKLHEIGPGQDGWIECNRVGLSVLDAYPFEGYRLACEPLRDT